MPHLVIEFAHTEEILSRLIELQHTAYDAAFSTGLFNKEAIKVRCIPVEHYVMPAQQKYFIHVNAKILTGRTAEQKQLVSDTLSQSLASIGFTSTEITIEVSEMQRDTYRKVYL